MGISKAVCVTVHPAAHALKRLCLDLASKAISDSDLAALKTQKELANAWRDLVPSFPQDCIHILPSIEHAIDIVRRQDGLVDVLVAGSLHLVGGVIEVAGLSEVAL